MKSDGKLEAVLIGWLCANYMTVDICRGIAWYIFTLRSMRGQVLLKEFSSRNGRFDWLFSHLS